MTVSQGYKTVIIMGDWGLTGLDCRCNNRVVPI